MDCNAHKALCDAHGVTTVPVVALYIPGKSSTPVGEILWPPTNQMIQAAPQYTLSERCIFLFRFFTLGGLARFAWSWIWPLALRFWSL